MTGELSLDPRRATLGGKDLSLAGTHLVGLDNGAVAEIAAASQAQPWGTDDIGAAFQQGYGPALEQFVDAFAQVAQFVEALGDAAVQSVQDNLAADDRSHGAVTDAYHP